jgi:hypothetical protein
MTMFDWMNQNANAGGYNPATAPVDVNKILATPVPRNIGPMQTQLDANSQAVGRAIEAGQIPQAVGGVLRQGYLGAQNAGASLRDAAGAVYGFFNDGNNQGGNTIGRAVTGFKDGLFGTTDNSANAQRYRPAPTSGFDQTDLGNYTTLKAHAVPLTAPGQSNAQAAASAAAAPEVAPARAPRELNLYELQKYAAASQALNAHPHTYADQMKGWLGGIIKQKYDAAKDPKEAAYWRKEGMGLVAPPSLGASSLWNPAMQMPTQQYMSPTTPDDYGQY